MSLLTTKHKTLEESEVKELIIKAQQGDEAAKEKLAMHHVRLVRNVVKRVKKDKNYDEDLMQIGMIGLLKAISRFDTNLNIKFMSFAIPTVSGEIRNFLRDGDSLLKVPRDVSVAARKIHGKELYEKTAEEIAEILDVDLKIAERALRSVKTRLVSIHTPHQQASGSTGDALTFLDTIGSDVNGDWFNKITFDILIDKLDAREKTIIEMRYRHEKSQAEIAPVVGISQVQVCRIEKKAIGKLKELFLGMELA